MDCPIYSKHHNIIDGVYMVRNPLKWEDVQVIDDLDAEDEEGELFSLFKDVKIYDIDEMSMVVDDDCMSGEVKEDVKYLILQPNCKLYTKWDDRGSLLF